ERHVIDDRADDDALSHEMLDGICHVAIIAPQPVHPANDQSVTIAEHVKEALAFWSLFHRNTDARYPLVGHYFVNDEPGCFRLCLLVCCVLVVGRYTGVKNGLHSGVHMGTLGLCTIEYMSVYQSQPLRTLFRAHS